MNIAHQDAIWEASKESASIYNDAIKLNQDGIPKAQAMKSLSIQSKHTKYLQSQSSQAPYQNFFIDLSSYFASLKRYQKSKRGYKNEPKPPHKIKTLHAITFKKSAIRVQNGYLLLSLRKPNKPIKLKWSLSKPIWVLINFDIRTGWKMNCVMEQEVQQHQLDKTKILAIDLGNKRIAASFDGKRCVTYSGKILKSLTRLQNKCSARSKASTSSLIKNSKKYKRVMRARRKITARINNQKRDILHKTSRAIVNYAIENNIDKIVFGDCSSIHDGTTLGKENTQQVQQGCEQKLRKYVEYKFRNVGGTTELVSERYSSQECPICDHRYEPRGRTYKCSACGYVYDRDGVGSINIYTNVSSGLTLDVVGGLMPPRGWKFYSQLPCTTLRNNYFSMLYCGEPNDL